MVFEEFLSCFQNSRSEIILTLSSLRDTQLRNKGGNVQKTEIIMSNDF